MIDRPTTLPYDSSHPECPKPDSGGCAEDTTMGAESKTGVSRGFRFQAGLPAVLRCGEEEYGCTAHDLSRTGVLLVGEVPLPAQTEVVITLRSQAGDLAQKFPGRVARPLGVAGLMSAEQRARFHPLLFEDVQRARRCHDLSKREQHGRLLCEL